MPRSQSRSRAGTSKSPARTKKTTPKSEPKKASRSRSASRGRPAKTPKTEPKKETKKATPKTEKKTPSRSRSRSRAAVKPTPTTAKRTPAKTPSKSPARTPAVKTPAAVKTPLPQASSTPYQRPTRSVKREAAGVASAKLFRPESYSPARLQVRSPSKTRPLLTRWKATISEKSCATVKWFKQYHVEVIQSIFLILFIALIAYTCLKTENNPVRNYLYTASKWVEQTAQKTYATAQAKANSFWNKA